MNTSTIFLIALALAVDAFAVALAAGVALPRTTFRHTFRLAWHFGLFQGGMAVIGWAAGLAFRSLIESFDHWLAFILLFLVGARMIHGALAADRGQKAAPDPTRGFSLVVLSTATSIDALAVGLSFAFLQTDIAIPALIIGLVALLLTAAGLHLGRIIRHAGRLGAGAEIGGGLVLIGIGFRILFAHGVF
ncbi:MAG: manganese efflux pump MntP family protein [Desulfurivibrionaceae bacterium]|nr:manganese efflux pump MntP family protein [Desulfurivibrionaceae bacterium]